MCAFLAWLCVRKYVYINVKKKQNVSVLEYHFDIILLLLLRTMYAFHQM